MIEAHNDKKVIVRCSKARAKQQTKCRWDATGCSIDVTLRSYSSAIFFIVRELTYTQLADDTNTEWCR